ncbi:MAG TPA: hypothetical protein VED41_07920 [Solirubrobacteraceae bacterium]|nr:hypothetical protein [Solirubrobacteraceae bacterium]
MSLALTSTYKATYYEDSAGNICVGLGADFGFPLPESENCQSWLNPGENNVGIGLDVFEHLDGGYYNVAGGTEALQSDTTGAGNVALSHGALQDNTSGDNNIGLSSGAVGHNKTGIYNIGIGYGSLGANVEGGYNLAIGNDPGATRGSGAFVVGSDNIDVSNAGESADNGTTRIGTEGTQTRAFVAGIYGKTIPGPTCKVLVNSAGQLGCKAEKGKKESVEMVEELDHQQQEIDELSAEVKALRK